MAISLEGNELRGGLVRRVVWGGALCLLLLPAVAMQFTDEMDWNGADFVAWGVMLGVACVANRLFFGVVLFAIVGSLLVRFRARGMARVMAATGAVQLAVCLYAWLAGLGAVFVYTAAMCLLWLAASRLFRRAAGTGSGSLIMGTP